MLFEISIVPVGGDGRMSDEVARAVDVIHESGLPYRLAPGATFVEGEWDEVMNVLRRCHERVREMTPHVVTSIRIEDDAQQRDQLEENVASVEKKLGHAAARS